MTTLTLRGIKGSTLTFEELDANFTNLDSDKYQAGDSASFSNVSVSGTVTANSFIGDGSGLTGVTSYVRADFDSDFGTKTTTDLTEGDNLYFTQSRARTSISVTDAGGDGSLEYNNTNGQITYTGPSATEVRAHFSAGNGIKINSGEISIDSASNVTFNSITTTDGLIVGGDLQVNGTTTTVSTENLAVGDNMLYLNADESDGSPTAFIDVGFAGNVNETGTYTHVGFFRDATDQVWKIFNTYAPEPDASVQINTEDASFTFAPLSVDKLITNATTGTAPLEVASTTLVDNLNADLLDGQEGSYYLNQNNHTNTPSRWQNTFLMMGA